MAVVEIEWTCPTCGLTAWYELGKQGCRRPECLAVAAKGPLIVNVFTEATEATMDRLRAEEFAAGVEALKRHGLSVPRIGRDE